MMSLEREVTSSMQMPEDGLLKFLGACMVMVRMKPHGSQQEASLKK